ncbi:unnamed protein product [Dibothriocephalus latus]|uniref:Uncharacterized protein n=1 Tax=Dibothriocephalus latus TaxID=60516 RepID=A0A3P6QGR8_DIBLA|nr:unnamed protein product [Dibothriocephalus latus]
MAMLHLTILGWQHHLVGMESPYLSHNLCLRGIPHLARLYAAEKYAETEGKSGGI